MAKVTADEASIRRLIERWRTAVRSRDLAAVVSIYAPDVVSFDVEAPLQYVGLEAKRKRWADTFAIYERVLDYEIRDLAITVGNDLAFAHSFNRLSGVLPNGQEVGFWLRWTSCFRKTDGHWLIAHEQISAPIDPQAGTACLHLEP